MKETVYLAGYEYRKIFKRRAAWIALAVVLAWVLFGGFGGVLGNYGIEGEKAGAMFQAARRERKALEHLETKELNQDFFQKKKEGMEYIRKGKGASSFGSSGQDRAGCWEEYAKYDALYGHLDNLLDFLTNFDGSLEIEEVDGNNFYQYRDRMLDGIYSGEQLSAGEIAFHQNENKRVQKPFAYGNMLGFERYLQMLTPTCIALAFALAIILAPMFAGESTTHMDALALSSRYGKNKLIWAKLLTGASIAVFSTICFAAISLLEVHALYGLSGWNLPVQVSMAGFHLSLPMNLLELSAIATGCCLAAVCMVAIVVMFCSARMKTPFGVIIVSFVFIFAPLYIIYLAAGRRVLFLAVNSLPTSMMFLGSITAPQLISVGGRYLYFFQWVPFAYLLCAAILVVWSYHSFQRHEVR